MKTSKPIFGIHGGGNIGLGLMADIVSHSKRQYHMIATSSNSFKNQLINCFDHYWIRHTVDQKQTDTKISNVHMLNARNSANIFKLYTSAETVAMCLTEEALIRSAHDIARSLLIRHYANEGKLNILVLMNKQNPDQFARWLIESAMQEQLHNTRLCQTILNRIQFIPTVADRIVHPITKENLMKEIQDQITEAQPQLADERFTSIQEISHIVKSLNLKFHLFNTEKNFALYVPEGFSVAQQFPLITDVKNLEQFSVIKNKFVNGPHAILAWFGGLMGYRTISEAIKDPILAKYITNLMENEIAPILQKAYPQIKHQQLQSLQRTFIQRCKNINDPITRVGRDPLRKLNRGGCVRGVVELRQKFDMPIETPRLEKGIAAGILYGVKNIDPKNKECQQMHDIYRKSGSLKAILCYNGPYGDGYYPGLDPIKDRTLLRNILSRAATIFPNKDIKH